MKVEFCVRASVILLLLIPCHSLAEDSDSLRVAKLEETVRALEMRVASLEVQLQNRKTPVRASGDRANWRQLQKGMSQEDVERLLGSPTKVDVYGSFTVWHYGYPAGGTVHFDDDSRAVKSWHEP